MPASSIAQIFIRLFAIKWFLVGGYSAFQQAFLFCGESFFNFTLILTFLFLATAVALWFIAPRLSRQLAKGNDGEVTLKGITEQQLFSTAFLTIGLYFAFTSFSEVFSWIHFFAINKSPDYGFHQEEMPSYYDLSEPAMTLVAGVILVFTAQIWAAKLCLRKNRD